MFKGHKITKLINNNWILDFTDYKGYHVNVINEDIKSCKIAFTTTVDNGNITFDKKCRVPVKVLREARKQIENYQMEMEECNE